MSSQLLETDIRPKKFDHDKLAAAKVDLNFLLERKGEFVTVACPACGASGDRYFEKNEIQYDQCSKCLTVFVNPRPTEALLHEFYARSELYKFWNDHIFPASEEARRKKIFVPRVNRLIDILRAHDISPGALLEVGAGYGTFCEEIIRNGYFSLVYAVEPTSHLAATCRKKGITVFESPVENIEVANDSIDVIASFETVEHLFSPREFLKSCQKYLKVGGMIVLSMPNFLSFDILTLREQSNSIDHEHLNYFNPQSISLLMNESGFEVIELQTPGELDLDIVRNKVLDNLLNLDKNLFTKYLLSDHSSHLARRFQCFLQQNLLSSHMWICAIKRQNP